MSARSFLAGLLILAAWGCQSTPVERAPAAPVATPEAAGPDQLMQRARAASGQQAAMLYLQAANRYFDDGNLTSARQALQAVDPDRLSDRALASYFLMQGTFAILDGDYRHARAALSAVDPAQLDRPLDLDLAEARLLAAEGRPRAAVAHLIAIEAGAGQAQQVNDAIWGYLNQVPAVQPGQAMADTGPIARGWWALRLAMLKSVSMEDQLARLRDWRSDWPEHPATLYPPIALNGLEPVRSAISTSLPDNS